MVTMLEVIPAEQTKKYPSPSLWCFPTPKTMGGKWKPKSRSIICLRFTSLKDYAPIIREPTVRPHPASLISVPTSRPGNNIPQKHALVVFSLYLYTEICDNKAGNVETVETFPRLCSSSSDSPCATQSF